MSARGLGVAARGLRALIVDLELDGDAANCVQLRAWKGVVAEAGVDDGRV